MASIKRALVTLLLISTAGCGTVENLLRTPHGPSIYGGVAYDVELIEAPNCSGMGVVFGACGLPFSLVMDTVTLPVTLLCEIFGWHR